MRPSKTALKCVNDTKHFTHQTQINVQSIPPQLDNLKTVMKETEVYYFDTLLWY